MLLTYTLSKEDFLTHQLYIASRSKNIQRNRTKGRLILPAIYAIISGMFYYKNELVLALAFFIFGLLWYLIYPLWERKRYTKHYQDFIDEHYKERCNQEVFLEIENDFLITKDKENEGKTTITQIKEIVELPNLILIVLQGGTSLLIPKNRLKAIDEVIQELKNLAKQLHIPYTPELTWQWK